MSKEDCIEVTGTVIEKFPSGLFSVQLDVDRTVLAHLAGKNQLPPGIVIADQHGRKLVLLGVIAANDKFLRQRQLKLLPGERSVARRVDRVSAFGYHSFSPGGFENGDNLYWRARQRSAVAHARFLHHRFKSFFSLFEGNVS